MPYCLKLLDHMIDVNECGHSKYFLDMLDLADAFQGIAFYGCFAVSQLHSLCVHSMSTYYQYKFLTTLYWVQLALFAL